MSSGVIAERLADMGLSLPESVFPAANYVPYDLVGKTVYVSGQLPFRDGAIAYAGKLGDDVSVAQGQAAAQLCALHILAQAAAAAGGDPERVDNVVKLTGFVNSAPEFIEQHKVVNGASDLMVAIFGDAGRHARAAVGVASLPLGAAVEVEGILTLR